MKKQRFCRARTYNNFIQTHFIFVFQHRQQFIYLSHCMVYGMSGMLVVCEINVMMISVRSVVDCACDKTNWLVIFVKIMICIRHYPYINMRDARSGVPNNNNNIVCVCARVWEWWRWQANFVKSVLRSFAWNLTNSRAWTCAFRVVVDYHYFFFSQFQFISRAHHFMVKLISNFNWPKLQYRLIKIDYH